MSVLSLAFIVFYLILLILYWSIPAKFKNGLLLIASWLYLASWSPVYLLFLIGTCIVSYVAGRFISNTSEEHSRAVKWLSISIVILLGALIIVKYTSLPLQVLGISFFTFQAVSYVVDVYGGDVEAEKDFIVYALYVSFFAQLVSGPIAKAKEQIARYKQEKVFDLKRTEKALILAVYGFFMKMVIADRIGVFVDSVYGNVAASGRVSIICAVLLYSVQIYCDFAGYTLIAIGIARSLGIELPANFKQPYLSKNIDDFWKRWHISLTSWFRDYLYFPLGGNRKGKARTYINVLIVFAVSGIWHGAGLTFVLWGLLHGLLQVFEKAFIKTKKSYRVLTYILVSLLWVLFRADSISQAGAILGGIVINDNGFAVSEVLLHGLNTANIVVLLIAMMIMVAVDIATYKGIDLIDKLFDMKLIIRWAILYALIFSVIILGVYGSGYDAAGFIYDKF